MAKTRHDFIPETTPWLVDNWIPFGHRCMDAAPEGSFKTMIGCWYAVCIASGHPIFGHDVYKGPVIIIDEETPKDIIDTHIRRFSQGIGVDYKKLPIYVQSMQGFRLDKKSKMKELLDLIDAVNPVFIRIDSLLAIMPTIGTNNENSDQLGIMLRDELGKLVSKTRTVMITAHGKKKIAELTFDEIEQLEMQSIVRGHGSIVGEGCDTGYVVRKISVYPEPTRFCIMTRPRRLAIPAGRPRYIEVVEQSYGGGWARLEELDPSKLPPSSTVRDIYRVIKAPDARGSFTHAAKGIKSTCALHTVRECRIAILELLARKVIIEVGPQRYELNPKKSIQCDADYLTLLEKK